MGPARFHCATLLSMLTNCKNIGTMDINILHPKIFLSEVGFEPTPTEVDCDLNAAP